MAYKGLQKDQSKKPNESVGCDLMEACQYTCIISSNKLKRLACFHVFHEKCLEENEGRCPKCTAFLMSKTAQLTKSFNEGLLSTTSSPGVSEESTPSDSNLDDDSVAHNNQNDPSYYASEEWQQEIDATLNTIHVPQPSQQSSNSVAASNTPTQQQSGLLSQSFNFVHQEEIDAALNTIHVPQPSQQSSSSLASNTPTQQQSALKSQSSNFVQQQDPSQRFLTFTSGSVFFWFFPQSISQATLHGRNGSNACTFIALLNARLFHLNANILDLKENFSLSQAWISLFITTITNGNNLHEKVTSGRPIDFTVVDAFPHLESALGKCEIEDSFDLSITCENTQIPQSSLAFYLQRLARENNLSAIVIMNGMSLCFVCKNDYLIALDSHPHNLQGAMVAQTKMGNREELLTALKLLLSPQFNTCSLTFVFFS